MATETASVLFTDLVGSTELRSRLGEDAADQWLRHHDELLAEAVAAAGGRVVKGLGDGVMATFGSAADAATAAVAIQQAAWQQRRSSPAAPLHVRIGISVGDVNFEDDDCFGTPVVEASRLCATALGGQIIAADLVRAMARGRGGHRFEPIGELELKGLTEPLPAALVVWDPPAVGDAGGRPPFPALLGGNGTVGYVGREALLERLGAAAGEALAGSCRTILLAGEPGVGKTHTSAEIARRAYDDGASVLYGRCDEAWGVPHQPFVEALDGYAESGPLGRLPGELARLLPDLATRVPTLPAPVASDPKTEEHRLFEAVTSWLVEASRAGGLVLVVDDLHWAAKPTLQLLLHVVRAAAAPGSGARLLVIGTYRDTDIDRSHPLSATMADLRRLPGVERLSVAGLTSDEVVTFVETAAGHELDADTVQLARRVHDETEGNPFFVGEVLRHLVETGVVRRMEDRWVVVDAEAVAVPEGVRDVVGRRVNQLSDTANAVLSLASVIGRDFELAVLAPLVDGGEDVTLDALDEALRARLVEESGPDRFRFAHALVRTTLYDELSAARRRRTHRRVADVIEKLQPDDVVALAHHTLEGGPEGGDLRRAITYSLAAADQALAARAMADAERRYHQTIDLFEDWEEPDALLHLRALCGLGEAQRDQGLSAASRETLLRASRAAAELGARDLQVRAVLANTRGFMSMVGKVDEDLVEALESALAALGDTPSPDRARVRGLLSVEVDSVADGGTRRVALAEAAVAEAAAVGDARTRAEVGIATQYALQRPSTWTESAARAEQILGWADEVGDPRLRSMARWILAQGHLNTGAVTASRAAAMEGLAIATADGTPQLVWMLRANAVQYLVYDGDIARARAENDEVLALGSSLGMEDVGTWWAAVLGPTAWLEGTYGDLADSFATFAAEFGGTPIWPAGMAASYADAGRFDEARAQLARMNLDLVFDGTGEMFTVPAWSQLGLMAHTMGDADLARRVRDAIRREHLDDAWAAYGIFLIGTCRQILGVCALTLGEHDDAIADLQGAIDMQTASGFEIANIRGRWYLAEAYRRRGGPGDAAAAEGVLAEARALAVRYRIDATWGDRLR